MDIIDIIILIFFVSISIFNLYSIKNLKVKSVNRPLESLVMIICIIALCLFTYFYTNTVKFYILGTLAILMLVTTLFDNGICDKGFVRQYRSYEILKWKNIDKIKISCEKYIKIELLGNFIDCTLYFKPSDYNKIMAILKEKSPAKIILNFKDNPNIN